MPVPGPIMMTGVLGLKGRRNCDFLTYMGTRELLLFSSGTLFLSQLVATPLFRRPVLVSYSTVTAQMWMALGWTCREGMSAPGREGAPATPQLSPLCSGMGRSST